MNTKAQFTHDPKSNYGSSFGQAKVGFESFGREFGGPMTLKLKVEIV